MHASETMTLNHILPLRASAGGGNGGGVVGGTILASIAYSSSLSMLAWRKSGNLIFTLHGADAVGFGDPLIAVLPSFHDIK